MSDENTNPTPTNSPQKEKKPTEKSPRITNSQKEKDPRKVAAGKKLGAISKMAKSQKKYKAEAHDACEEKEETQKIPNFYIVVTVCAIAGVLGVIYFKTKKLQGSEILPEKQQHQQRSNLISLE